MKKIYKFIFPIFSILLAGCGHSMYHKVEGTGVYGRIPTPNGGSLVEVAIGDMNITSGILRGGATLDENSSKGGTFGSVSIARHTHLSTIPAMNEGNIRDVLTSPNTDDKTKQLIAEYLTSIEQNPAPAATVTSVNAASATGSEDSIPEAIPTKTGMDNIVDKAAEIAPPIVDTVATNTASTIKDVANNVESGITKTSDSFFDKVKSLGIWIIIGLVIIIVIGEILYFFFKHKKSKKSTSTIISEVSSKILESKNSNEDFESQDKKDLENE